LALVALAQKDNKAVQGVIQFLVPSHLPVAVVVVKEVLILELQVLLVLLVVLEAVVPLTVLVVVLQALLAKVMQAVQPVQEIMLVMVGHPLVQMLVVEVVALQLLAQTHPAILLVVVAMDWHLL
jgi:hypothetical protein